MPEGQGEIDLRQVLNSPIRVRILELWATDASLPLEVEPLTEALAKRFSDVTPKKVYYHLCVLRDAELIPTT
jgi:DNA-binding transcriptional ArsR family regulator